MSDALGPPTNPDGLAGPPCPGWDDEPAGLSEVARRRRDEIMDAAEAVIADSGIDKLSLKEIETRAGMSRGQLTYYFKEKELILLAVYQRMLRRMIRTFLAEEGPKPMTGRAWDCIQFMFGRELGPAAAVPPGKQDFQSLQYTFLAQMAHRDDYRRRLSDLQEEWRKMMAADIATSVPPPHPVPPAVLASLVQALVHGISIQLAVNPDAFDRVGMLSAITTLLAPLFGQRPPEPEGTDR